MGNEKRTRERAIPRAYAKYGGALFVGAPLAGRIGNTDDICGDSGDDRT